MNSSGIKRILVALDASEANRSALQAAMRLASQLQAELQAVFVEDINLLRLAELPFAREMMPGSRQARRITLTDMERQIAEQAARLRQLVEAMAAQSQIKAEFKILRGQVSNELCMATRQMDLLILGKSTQLLQRSLKLGTVAQDVLATVNCTVLLLQYGASIDRPVAILYEGSETSQRALQLAIHLAHGDHDQLKVIFPAVSAQKLQELQQQVQSLTRSHGIDVGHVLLGSNSSDALLQAITQSNSRVLVLEASSEGLNPEAIRALVQQSPIPVIVMR